MNNPLNWIAAIAASWAMLFAMWAFISIQDLHGKLDTFMECQRIIAQSDDVRRSCAEIWEYLQ